MADLEWMREGRNIIEDVLPGPSRSPWRMAMPATPSANGPRRRSRGRRPMRSCGRNGRRRASRRSSRTTWSARLRQPEKPKPNGHAPPTEKWPDPLGQVAFHGLAGDVVGAFAPHTEADPVAILLQFLAAFGNAAGRWSYMRVEATAILRKSGPFWSGRRPRPARVPRGAASAASSRRPRPNGSATASSPGSRAARASSGTSATR